LSIFQHIDLSITVILCEIITSFHVSTFQHSVKKWFSVWHCSIELFNLPLSRIKQTNHHLLVSFVSTSKIGSRKHFILREIFWWFWWFWWLDEWIDQPKMGGFGNWTRDLSHPKR
jgi:hypothetical protein